MESQAVAVLAPSRSALKIGEVARRSGLPIKTIRSKAINRFSEKLTTPSGTLALPPTQAQLSSNLSMNTDQPVGGQKLLAQQDPESHQQLDAGVKAGCRRQAPCRRRSR